MSKKLLMIAGGMIVVTTILFFVPRVGWARQKRQLIETIRSAEPLIDAISQFEKARGRPPRALAELVPEFVLRIHPPSGPAHGNWEYWTDTPGGQWHVVMRDPEAGNWALGIAVEKSFRPSAFYTLGDYFVYHPSGRYSRRAYGGTLEECFGWGYYRE